ncbi:MAG: hypothetical protein M9894_14000 [Planctomycetes bacterium]|nr:hypothetical protein [Planctomycetota bacterium]
MRAHDAGHARLERPPERRQVARPQRVARALHDRQGRVRVVGRGAVPGEVLRAGQRARRLDPLDHGRTERRHPGRVRAERARADDRVPGLVGQVEHGAEEPVDPHRERLARDRLARAPRQVLVVGGAEGQERRQVRAPPHLLAEAALEVGGDEQAVGRLGAQGGQVGAERRRVAAEEDEAPDAAPGQVARGLERGGRRGPPLAPAQVEHGDDRLEGERLEGARGHWRSRARRPPWRCAPGGGSSRPTRSSSRVSR